MRYTLAAIIGATLAVAAASSQSRADMLSVIDRQGEMLVAEIDHSACKKNCILHATGTAFQICRAACETAFEREIDRPLAGTGGYLIRHVSVPAGTQRIDTGIDLPENGEVQILAIGGWSADGRKVVGPDGDVQKVGTSARGKLLGQLGYNGPVFEIGTVTSTRFRTSGGKRLYLGMNDLPSKFPNHRGTLKVSVMVDAPAGGEVRATTSIDARLPRVATGVFLSPGTEVVLSATGTWTDGRHSVSASPFSRGCRGSCPIRTLTPDGAANQSDDFTPLPHVSLGALIGYVGDDPFAIGSYTITHYPVGGELFLGMNEVPAGFDDNAGQLQATISLGGFIE